MQNEFYYSGFENFKDKIILTQYRGKDTKLIIPSIIDGYEVAAIDDAVFKNSAIEEIEFPETIRHIGTSCFENSKINKVKFNNSESIITIKNNCFKNCKELENVELPDTKIIIQRNAFFNCEKIKSLKINAYTIEPSAFENCISLTNLTCSTVDIGQYAFKNTNIYLIELDNIQQIGFNAFADCKNLHRLTIGKIQAMSDKAFENCYIKTVILKNNIVTGYSRVFPDALFKFEGKKQDLCDIGDCNHKTIIYDYKETLDDLLEDFTFIEANKILKHKQEQMEK